MVKNIKRLFYQAGMALGEKELTIEQNYHNLHRRIHNFYMHGWGIVAGLLVQRAEGALKNSYSVTITPGLALLRDSTSVINGNLEISKEVILTEPRTIDLDRFRPVVDSVMVYVYVAYHEEQDTPEAGDLSSNSGLLNINAGKNIYTYEQPGFFVGVEKPSNSGENLILARVELTPTSVGIPSYEDDQSRPLRKPASELPNNAGSINAGDLNANQPGTFLNRLKTIMSGGASWPDIDGDGQVDIRYLLKTLVNKFRADVIPFDNFSSVSDRLNALGMSGKIGEIVKGIYDGDKATRLEMIQALTRKDVIGNLPVFNDLINMALTIFSVVTIFAETEKTPFVPAGSLGEGMDIKLDQFFKTEGAGAYQWRLMRKSEDLMHLGIKSLSDFLLTKGITAEMVSRVSDFETLKYTNHQALRFYFLTYIYNSLMNAMGGESGIFDLRKIQTLIYEFIEYFFTKYYAHLQTSTGDLFSRNLNELDANMALIGNFSSMIRSINNQGLTWRLNSSTFTDGYPGSKYGDGKIFFQSDAGGKFFWLRTEKNKLCRFPLTDVEKQLAIKDKLPAAYADYVSPPVWPGPDIELVITGEDVIAASGSAAQMILFTKITSSVMTGAVMAGTSETYNVHTIKYADIPITAGTASGTGSLSIDLKTPGGSIPFKTANFPQGVIPSLFHGALNPDPWIYIMSYNPDISSGLLNLNDWTGENFLFGGILSAEFMFANSQVFIASSGVAASGSLEKNNRAIFVTRKNEGVLISAAVFAEGTSWYTDLQSGPPPMHHFLLLTDHLQFVDIVNDQVLVNLNYPFNSPRSTQCFTFLSLKAMITSGDEAWGKDGVGTFALRVKVNADGNIVFTEPPSAVASWENVFSMNEIMLHRVNGWGPVYDTEFRKAFVRTNRGTVIYDFNSKEKFPVTKGVLPNSNGVEIFTAVSPGNKTYVCYYRTKPEVAAEFVDYGF